MSLFFLGIGALAFYVAVAAEGNAGVTLTKVFGGNSFGFTVAYPDGWLYSTQGQHTVVFMPGKETGAQLPSVIIKNLLSDKRGGSYKDVEAVIRDLENQLKLTPDAVIYGPDPFQYDKNGVTLSGRRCVAEYSLDKVKYKQSTIVVARSDGTLFHVWSYTAPAVSYDKYLPLAEAMLTAWEIKG